MCRALAGLMALGLFCSCGQKKPAADAGSATASGSTNAPATPARSDPAFDKLTGRWQRPDGGYILEISGIDASGKLEAAYLNPGGPIHVSRAFAFKEGEASKIFVELRDTGYPGCTYSLKYDPQADQLFGEYFQAAMQQTFDVTFARLK